MRKLLLILCLVLGVLLTVSVAAAQEDEGGVTIPLLADGETVEGEFETSTMQIYMLYGSEGDEVSVSMEADDPSLLDTFVVLLSTSGEVIAYNDDIDFDGGDYNSAFEGAELPDDGRYIVLATTFSELPAQTVSEDAPLDEPLSYTLTASGFSEPEDLDGVDMSNNFILEAEDGVVAAEGVLTLSPELPVAFIFFPAEEGQTISMETSESSDSDTILTDSIIYVFDAAGQRIAGSDDIDFEGENYYSEVEVTAPDSGTYIAFVTSFGFWAAAEDPDNYPGVGDVIITLEVE